MADYEHPAYLVYGNLRSFLESRGLTPAAGADLEQTREKFITALEMIGYFRLDAESDTSFLTVLILAPFGKYTSSGPALGKLVSSLGAEKNARANRPAEVMVVAPPEVAIKKNMVDAIAALRAGPAANPAGPRYNMRSYSVLSLDLPRCQAVPKHEIAPPSEVEDFLVREHLRLQDLPGITASDPPVVWIGGQPGQVVRVTLPSETAGEACVYRRVIARD